MGGARAWPGRVLAASLMAVACNAVLGIEEKSYDGSGGRGGTTGDTGGTSSSGSAGTGGTSSDGSAGTCKAGDKQCKGNVPQTCDTAGAWQDGTPCPFVCSAGSCTGECQPGAKQCNGQVPQTCDASGQWQSGSACQQQACVSGECQGVCAPGAKQCNGQVPQTCDASGQWQSGSACQQQACVSGECQGVCAPGAKQCSGDTPQTCDANGQWQSGTACGGSTPVCRAGECVRAGPSCDNLAATCGKGGDASCCASSVVTGGTFKRSYDGVTYTHPNNPATVSDFRMDTYEITVGRFRAFVNAGYGTRANPPAAGSGANPKLVGSGWQVMWNDKLTANTNELTAALKCNKDSQTWTDNPGPNENRPINCITWYEAFAFCIWDGGRLPTEAEWNYAAAGGNEQRAYPWSQPPSSTTIDCSYANYSPNWPTSCHGGTNDVGSESPTGDGKWGQSDLAGNVWEWVLDGYADYPNPCNDCANLSNLSDASHRVIRGGSYFLEPKYLLVSFRLNYDPRSRDHYVGARCVRSP